MAKFFTNAIERLFRHFKQLGPFSVKSPLEGRWVHLPSGRVKKAYGYEVIVSTHNSDLVYWWLCRDDRALIEGPANTVVDAIVESERALMAFALDVPLPAARSKGVN